MSEVDERLIKACDELNLEGVMRALEEGAEPNCDSEKLENGNILSNVIMAAWWEGTAGKAVDGNEMALKIVSLLLEHGTDPNRGMVEDEGTSFWTPIYDAVHYGYDTRLAELLLQHGADVNLPHDDCGFTIDDMLRSDWSCSCPDLDREVNETPYQSYRRTGRRYFMFKEFLLQNGSRRACMLCPEESFKDVGEQSRAFLRACADLDAASLQEFLERDGSLIGSQDAYDDGYVAYVIDWGSHVNRCRYGEKREAFETDVIRCLEVLTAHDPQLVESLAVAASYSLSYGYMAVLQWCLGRLKSLDSSRFDSCLADLKHVYRHDAQYYLPEGQCAFVEELVGLTELSVVWE